MTTTATVHSVRRVPPPPPKVVREFHVFLLQNTSRDVAEGQWFAEVYRAGRDTSGEPDYVTCYHKTQDEAQRAAQKATERLVRQG